MNAEYRFLQTRSGVTSFARIQVEAAQGGLGNEIVDATPAIVDGSAGEFNRASAPAWVEAALAGIRRAVDVAGVIGWLSSPCRAQLTRLIGSPADTREDVVWCAAFLATWKALDLPGPAPAVEFAGEQWRVRLPPVAVSVAPTGGRS